MVLHCRQYGAGKDWLIVHGLFGQGSNWHTLAKRWSATRHIVVPDLPNHGHSGRGQGYDYPALARDIVETADALGIADFGILGHSMGGKVAMQVAADFPGRVSGLVAVDIAPRRYPPMHNHIIKALMDLPLDGSLDRRGLDERLAATVSCPKVRAFFLKSLVHRPGGAWEWRLGLEEIRHDYAEILAAPSLSAPVEIPSLFVAGGRSVFVREEDKPEIRRLFPQSRLAVIPEASHLVHVEATEAFDALVNDFMSELESTVEEFV